MVARGRGGRRAGRGGRRRGQAVLVGVLLVLAVVLPVLLGRVVVADAGLDRRQVLAREQVGRELPRREGRDGVRPGRGRQVGLGHPVHVGVLCSKVARREALSVRRRRRGGGETGDCGRTVGGPWACGRPEGEGVGRRVQRVVGRHDSWLVGRRSKAAGRANGWARRTERGVGGREAGGSRGCRRRELSTPLVGWLGGRCLRGAGRDPELSQERSAGRVDQERGARGVGGWPREVVRVARGCAGWGSGQGGREDGPSPVALPLPFLRARCEEAAITVRPREVLNRRRRVRAARLTLGSARRQKDKGGRGRQQRPWASSRPDEASTGGVSSKPAPRRDVRAQQQRG